MAVAPATGTPETGGWSTRELRTILRGLEGINLVAADIVEVAVSIYLPALFSPSVSFLWEVIFVVHDTIPIMSKITNHLSPARV